MQIGIAGASPRRRVKSRMLDEDRPLNFDRIVRLAGRMGGRGRPLSAKMLRRRRAAARRRASRALKLVPRTIHGRSNRRLLPLPGWQILICRMEPGSWYATVDLQALMPEYAPRSTNAFVWQELKRRSLLQRAMNPDYKGLPNGKRQSRMPWYLYALSPRAIEARPRLLAVLSGATEPLTLEQMLS